MSISEQDKTDLTGTGDALTDVAADNANLPSADIPISIGSPAEWDQLPMANLVAYLNAALTFPSTSIAAPTTLWTGDISSGGTTEYTLNTGESFADWRVIAFRFDSGYSSAGGSGYGWLMTEHWNTPNAENHVNNAEIYGYDTRYFKARRTGDTTFILHTITSTIAVTGIYGVIPTTL